MWLATEPIARGEVRVLTEKPASSGLAGTRSAAEAAPVGRTLEVAQAAQKNSVSLIQTSLVGREGFLEGGDGE